MPLHVAPRISPDSASRIWFTLSRICRYSLAYHYPVLPEQNQLGVGQARARHVRRCLIVGPLTFFDVLLTNHSHDLRAFAQIAADQDKFEKQLLHDANRLAMQLDHVANEALLERASKYVP